MSKKDISFSAKSHFNIAAARAAKLPPLSNTDIPLKKGDEIIFENMGISSNYWIVSNPKEVKMYEEELTKLMEKIDTFAKPVVGSALVKGQIVAARWSEDEKMYRALITEIDTNLGKVKVRFVDYGNHGIVSFAHIFELPKFFASRIPILAKIIDLEGVPTLKKDHQMEIWLKEMVHFLSDKCFIKEMLQNGKCVVGHPNGTIVNEIIAKKLTLVQPMPKKDIQTSSQWSKMVQKCAIENSFQRAQPVKSYPCIYLDCPYRFTLENIEKHLNDAHKITKIKAGTLEKTRNIMPLHIEENFKTNFTFMVVEAEVQNQKFYLVCHHQMNVFSFHVIMKSDDEKEAAKYMYNIAIEDGSRDEHNQGEFWRRQGTVLPWGIAKDKILKLAPIKMDDLEVRKFLPNGKFIYKLKIKAKK